MQLGIKHTTFAVSNCYDPAIAIAILSNIFVGASVRLAKPPITKDQLRKELTCPPRGTRAVTDYVAAGFGLVVPTKLKQDPEDLVIQLYTAREGYSQEALRRAAWALYDERKAKTDRLTRQRERSAKRGKHRPPVRRRSKARRFAFYP